MKPDVSTREKLWGRVEDAIYTEQLTINRHGDVLTQVIGDDHWAVEYWQTLNDGIGDVVSVYPVRPVTVTTIKWETV